jgi:hypothetical protein
MTFRYFVPLALMAVAIWIVYRRTGVPPSSGDGGSAHPGHGNH